MIKDFPSNKLPGFNERLIALLPALEEHHCGVGERGASSSVYRKAPGPGTYLEHVVVELLNLSGMPTVLVRPQHLAARRLPHGFPRP